MEDLVDTSPLSLKSHASIHIACCSVSYYNLSMALVSPSYPEYSLGIWPHDIIPGHV